MEIKRPFSNADWAATPEPVRAYIIQLEELIVQLYQKIEQLEKRTEELEARLNQNSQNSNKPPSSDAPFKKPERKKTKKKKKRKRGGQKGHKGHRQQMLEPTEIKNIYPDKCRCGKYKPISNDFVPFYTHQHIELPEIKMLVTHYVLHKGPCANCGKTVAAKIPKQNSTGYGPRLSAVIAELSGSHGASRQSVQGFCQSVFGVSISTGGIQCIIDRASEAIKPTYDQIGCIARRAKVNHIDETSWFQTGQLKWLWTMVNTTVAFFMVLQNRSKKAFEQLIDDWKGILVSDNYGVYVKWVKRQSCLAHYIRKAKGLAQREDESVRRFGQSILKELRLLCHWARKPPTEKQWTDFYSRLTMLLFLFADADDDAGKMARSIERELESLWLFLEENGVEPTNNRAERSLRFAVLWRKRSNGTQSNKGDRWVERILSLKQTCCMRSTPIFPILVDALNSYFKEQRPDMDWLLA
jgi:transposase